MTMVVSNECVVPHYGDAGHLQWLPARCQYNHRYLNSLPSFKPEHSAFKAFVTRVTLPYFCDSRYICDSRYDVQDSMVWCKMTRHMEYWYHLIKYYKKEENNKFQCQLSMIYFCMEKNHISVTRVTLPYQLMFEIILWENKLDHICSVLQHS